jgi:steroid delta-isomerase-like uncharacterized protein
MSTETNKAIVRRIGEQIWNEQRREQFEEFYVENAVLHSTGAPSGVGSGLGLEGIKTAYDKLLSAFPDIQLTTDDLIAEGDKVVSRWTLHGTHQGELMGIPVTGKQVTQSGTSIFRLDNARVVEVWVYADNLGLMQQLGAIPAP